MGAMQLVPILALAATAAFALGKIEHVAELAEAWGSRFENIGAVGHLNPAAGFGEWPLAESLIEKLGTPPGRAG